MTDEDLNEDRGEYSPSAYWDQRLRDEFSLRGVGHVGYPASYNEWVYRQKRRTLRRLLPPVTAGAKALDVGSGVGWVVNELVHAGYRVDGCDISPTAIEELRRRFPTSEFTQVEIGSDGLPAADASYDLVTILDVTYHIVDDAIWNSAITELARVMRPGGTLIVLDRLGPTTEDAAAHVRFRSLRAWEELGGRVGLATTQVIPAYRWISRARNSGPLHRVPPRLRGPLEYALERFAPRPAHMRAASFIRADSATTAVDDH